MIRRIDAGSKVVPQIEMEDENAQPKFKRMYIRCNAQKLGFLVVGALVPSKLSQDGLSN